MSLYLRRRSPFWWASISVGTSRERFSTEREHLFPPGTICPPARLTPAQKAAKTAAETVEAVEITKRLDVKQLGLLDKPSLKTVLERVIRSATKHRDRRNLISRARKVTGLCWDAENRCFVDDPDPNFEGRASLDPNAPFHEAVTTITIEDLRQERLDEGNSENTINREVALIQRAYNVARKSRVQVDPSVDFPKFRVDGKLRYYTMEEETKLLAELNPYTKPHGCKEVQEQRIDQYDFVILLLDTGGRYSEVSALSWDAVDTRDWKWLMLYSTKVRKEIKHTPTRRVRAVLERRYAARGNHAFVFSNKAGGHRGYAPQGIRRAIDRCKLNAPHLVERYGRATLHTFRDTFASRLVQAGVSLYEVQRLLGHSSPQMTQKYAKLAPDQTADRAASVLDQIHATPAAA